MLHLKKSLIPGAGKGLFTKTKFTRGDIVCEYVGEIIPWSECEKRAEQGYEGYVFFITKYKCIDAYFTKDAIGRYANDAKGITRIDGLKNNAQYEIKVRKGEKTAFIVATRTINPGDEILVDYGKDYWENLNKFKPLYEEMKRKKKAERAAQKKTIASSVQKKSSARK